MKKNMHFLKVMFSLIMIFTSSFIMSSCEEEETTSIVSDYEQFENDFDEHYPDGYTMEDGWYSVKSVETNYRINSDQQDSSFIYNTMATDFSGDLEFSDSLYSIEGKVNSFSMNSFRTRASSNYDGSLESDDYEEQTCFDGNNYSLIENYKSGDYQYEYNWGANSVENPPFRFYLGTDYNSLGINFGLLSDYDILDGKSIRMVSNDHSTYDENGILYYEYIDAYTFDDDFKLIESRYTKHTEVTSETYYYCTDATIIMTPTKEIEVDVPTEYDLDLPSSYFDEFEIEIKI